MRKAKTLKKFEPGHGFAEADWDVVDSPELTDEELATARPFAEVFPELAAKIRRGRGRNKAPTKQLVSLRLSPDVLKHFKDTGPGWQKRIDETLQKATGLAKVAKGREMKISGAEKASGGKKDKPASKRRA